MGQARLDMPGNQLLHCAAAKICARMHDAGDSHRSVQVWRSLGLSVGDRDCMSTPPGTRLQHAWGAHKHAHHLHMLLSWQHRHAKTTPGAHTCNNRRSLSCVANTGPTNTPSLSCREKPKTHRQQLLGKLEALRASKQQATSLDQLLAWQLTKQAPSDPMAVHTQQQKACWCHLSPRPACGLGVPYRRACAHTSLPPSAHTGSCQPTLKRSLRLPNMHQHGA